MVVGWSQIDIFNHSFLFFVEVGEELLFESVVEGCLQILFDGVRVSLSERHF